MPKSHQSRKKRRSRQSHERRKSLLRACKGKYRKEGGLDTEELKLIAKNKGLVKDQIVPRKELIGMLCPSGQSG